MISLLLNLFLIMFGFLSVLLIEPGIKKNIDVYQMFGVLDQNTPQKEITEKDLIGRWLMWAKTNNKYRSNPYQGPKNSYSFKEDYSIVIVTNNNIAEGSWTLSDKSEITIIIDGKAQIYRITQFKDNSMILMDSSSYLSLKKYH